MLDDFRFVYRVKAASSGPLASSVELNNTTPLDTANGDNATLESQTQATTTIATNEVPSRAVVTEPAAVPISKDIDMTRMVDNLVGQDDALDILPEKQHSIPPTPNGQSFEDAMVAQNTTYGAIQLSAGDYVQPGQKSSHVREPAELMTNFAQPTRSPPIRTLPYIPSLPDQPSIWSPHHDSSGPSSPLLGVNSRMSPARYGINGSGHSRNQSLNSSVRDSQIIPSSFDVTVEIDGAPNPLNGCAQPGTFPNNFPNSLFSTDNPRGVNGAYNNGPDYRTLSPFLFGAGQRSWGSERRTQASLLSTPRNGQDG